MKFTSLTKDKPGSTYRPQLYLWLVYLLLAVILTWPTSSHLTTHLPGDGGDDPAIAWNLWWVKYALLNAGQNPFYTDFMFYPVGINLAFYTLTLLNALTALPLTLNLGVVAASNLHTWFTFVVGGYGAFLLSRYVLKTFRGCAPLWFCAACAGMFYAFASSKLFYVALGQFNIASNHWVPFAVLYVLRTHDNPRRLKNALMAGLFLTLQAWAELTYASFILVFMSLYWLYEGCAGLIHWIKSNHLPPLYLSGLPHLRAIVIIFIIGLIGLSPVLAQMLPDMLAEGDFMVEGSGFAQAFSADLLGFVIPTIHHPWFGQLITQTGITAFDKGQHIYLGFVLLGLLGVSLFTGYRRPEIRFWLLVALVFTLLCLGPVITINGHPTGLPGPFVLLQNLPFIKGNRYPSRYSVMLLLSLSVLAGWAIAQVSRIKYHVSGSRVAGSRGAGSITIYVIHNMQYILRFTLYALLPLLFIFENLSTPLPQSDMRLPSAYQLIAAEPGDFTVLDIPFAWRNGFRITGALTTQFMFGQFYQTTHQKRLLQGNTSRNPEFKFQYFTNAPVIKSLLALETGQTLPPAQWAADTAIAADTLRFFNIKYIVVRPYSYGGFNGTKTITVTEQAAQSYVEQVLPVDLVHNETTIKIYKVKDTPLPYPSSFTPHPSPLSPLYFGEGWGLLSPGRPIAAQRRAARLLLPLTGAAQRVILRLRSLDKTPQTIALALNGWQSPPQTISAEWQELTFSLPPNIARPGLNDLYLRFSQVTRLPAFAVSQPLVDITALSAGQDVGDFGYIYVNGVLVSPDQRGYNGVIVQPDGHLRAANFDTHLDPAASSALAHFIRTARPDDSIAIAAADEASANLSEEAVLALRSIGASGDLRGCFRCSHALIRQAGQVKEAFDRLAPVGVTTQLGLTEPTIAAQVEWLRVEPGE